MYNVISNYNGILHMLSRSLTVFNGICSDYDIHPTESIFYYVKRKPSKSAVIGV